jgi:hypothetical protein
MLGDLIRELRAKGLFDQASILSDLDEALEAENYSQAKIEHWRLVREHGMTLGIVALGEFEDVRITIVLDSARGGGISG